MKRTLVYRRWIPDPHISGDFMSRVRSATTGEDGVEEFYTSPDGMVEIRMTDPNAETYWVPAHQVLALRIVRE